MPSLNLDLDYFDHPKTQRLIAILGPGSEILPLRLWVYVAKFHPKEGGFPNYSEDEIEGIAKWGGMRQAMLQAFLRVGFLEKRDETYYVHDWDEHAGHILVYKDRAKIMAQARWEKARVQDKAKTRDAHSNAQSNASRNAPSNATSNASAGQCSAVQGSAEVSAAGASVSPSPKSKRKPKADTNPDHQPFIDWYTARWSEIHKAKYPFHPRDARAVASILISCQTLDAAKNAAERFLHSSDRYHAGHSLCTLAQPSALPRFIAADCGGNGHPKTKKELADEEFNRVIDSL